MSSFEVIRIFRTPHSERFMLRESAADGRPDGEDVALIDLHYLPSSRSGQSVHALVTLLEDGPLRESDVSSLLAEIDDLLLGGAARSASALSSADGPDHDSARSVTFTVILGRMLGVYTPES